MKYTIKIFQEEDNSLYAEVLELPWCFSSWKNMDELKVNIKEAIECYIEWMKVDVEKECVSYDYFKQYA